MDTNTNKWIEQYAIIEAIKVEVEAMKAANQERKRRGESLAYPESAFFKLSAKLNAISLLAASAPEKPRERCLLCGEFMDQPGHTYCPKPHATNP